MSSLRVEPIARMDPEQGSRWSTLLRDTCFGAVAIPWTEALRADGPANLEVHYLQVLDGNRPRALVILHILRQLDLSEYMGPGIGRLFAPLARLGWRPLAADLAFLEVPVANVGGIRLVPGSEADAAAIGSVVVAYVRSHFTYSVLSLKARPSAAGEDAFAGLGLMSTNFLAVMRIEFDGERGFDDYLRRVKPQVRTQCRAFARQFADAGGTIDIVQSPDAALYEVMEGLYARTLRYHRERSSLQLPIPHSREFFPSLLRSLPGASRVFLARLHGDPVAFSLVLDSGSTSFFTHTGLDYDRTVPSRAYFNLYYAIIDDAIRRGQRSVDLGAEAYAVKRKLRAVPHPTVYHFEVSNPVLRRVASLVARNFASQEGAQLDA